MVNEDTDHAGPRPVQRIEDGQRGDVGARQKTLHQAEGFLAQQGGVLNGAPGIRGLFAPLNLGVFGQGVVDALGGAERMFLVEEKIVHDGGGALLG